MESGYGVQLPRKLSIEFSQIIQQLSDSSGKEVTSPMIWETFRAEYLESRTEVASALLTWIMGNSMSLQDISHKTGAGQIEMLVQMVRKFIGTSLRIVKQEQCHTVSQNREENIVFLEMCVGEADHVFGVGMHEDPIRAGFNSVISAIDRAARTKLLPSLKGPLDHDVSLSM
jgi:2-isopropylmalate synthase